METKTVKPIPEGYHTITPYLIAEGAENLIQFLKQGFDAKEISNFKDENGKIRHSEILVGNSMLMISEASENWKANPGSFYVYVENVDNTYKKALEAGGVSTMEPADMFYGDRNAGVKDASGNDWWISTHIEDVSPEEMKIREQEYAKQQVAS